MFEVRVHGRRGQGVVTAAEMLSVAAFLEGKHAQAFPSFGSERTGAPVVAFCRIADKDIRLREPIQHPDALIVQDPTLFKALDVLEGLKPNGYLIVNTARSLKEMQVDQLVTHLPEDHVKTVPANDLAMKFVNRPAPNTALLGARCLSCGNCFECDNCYGVCPDNAVIKLGPGKRLAFNYDYCKGCGLCAEECRCGAIDMVPEAI